MGAGIFVIVVGVLVGGALAASPRRLWWAMQSWKFRNPEANEPSDIAYGMTRASGVFVIIVSLVLGGVFIGDEISKSAADKRQREAEAQQRAAEAAFVVPPPEQRGPLPVIGYFAEPTARSATITVYYQAPAIAVDQYFRSMSNGDSYPCYTSPIVNPAGEERITVSPELIWAPEKLGDMSKVGACRPGEGLAVRAVQVDDAAVGTTVVTDSAIIDPNGTEIRRAAPGNSVPKLSAKLRTNR